MNIPPSVFHIVTTFDRLRQLTERAERMRQLDVLLKRHCQAIPADGAQVATLRDGNLVVHAETAALAAKMRYLVPEIIKSIEHLPDFRDVRSIRIKTVRRPLEQPMPRVQARMSPENAKIIEALANSTADDRLRAALLRLASRGQAPGVETDDGDS